MFTSFISHVLPATHAHRILSFTGAFTLGLLGLLLDAVYAPSVQAQEVRTAEVVVQFDDKASIIRAVEFTTPISGLVALERSGLNVVTVTSEFGTTVCSIQGVGCPADDCFCQCSGDDTCRYWGYSFWDNDDWTAYEVGADASLVFADAAVEGWRWGEFGAAMTPFTRTQAAGRALAALRTDQLRNGIGSARNAVDTMLAAGANQLPAQTWAAADGSLVTALMADATRYMRVPSIAPAAAGKMAIAAAATGACWPVSTLLPGAFYDAELGAYSEFSGINSWAILGVLALDEDVPTAAVATLQANIQPDGGWEWMTGFGSDTNTTALALQALIGVGESVTATEVISGLLYLDAAQNDDGGFAYDPSDPEARQSDANSTAFAIQALLAAGEMVDGPDWQTLAGNTPFDYLLSMQLSDGTFAWQSGSGANTLATQQAIPALLGQAYPLRDTFLPDVGIESCRGSYLPVVIPGTASQP